MKKVLSTAVVAASASLLLTGCFGAAEEVVSADGCLTGTSVEQKQLLAEESNGGIELADGTVLLPPEAASDIDARPDGKEGQRVVLTQTPPCVDSVFTMNATETSDGVLGRVSSVEQEGDTWVVITDPVGISEAYSKFSFSF